MVYRTMTYQQVAEFLRVNVRTVKRYVAEGKIPTPTTISYKVKRFDEQEFYSWWEGKGKGD